MRRNLSPYWIFPGAGFLSGVASGISVALPPLGLFCPPIFFGIAITQALHRTLTPVTFWQRMALIGISVLAFALAMIGAILAIRLPGFDNGIFGGACSGAIGGGIGSFLIALGLILIVEDSKPLASLPVMTLAGMVCGALFAIVGVMISDNPADSHPLDDLIVFPLWQMGVASTIPMFRCRPLQA